jgi:hypothetical protein
MTEFLEQGQRRIDHARARAVGTPDLLFDRLDDLVPVPWLFGDEMQDDQAKVAVREEPTEPGSATPTMRAVFGPGILVSIFAAFKALAVVSARVSMVH